MPDRNPKINRLLIFITVFLCLICGLLFTQASAGPFGNNYNSVVTGNTDDISIMASNSGHNSTSSSTEVSATPSITPSPAPSKVPENGNVSPEAENGIWTADGSDWKFLVNGEAYTGWLTDTDGHRYYFSENGVMQRGWIKLNKKRYYLDEDGILQTGTLTIDGKKYTFDSNGILLITPESNGSKTIKNYLAGALLPVGKALYVWGGGWNDSTRKGLSPTMTAFYNSQTADYNYNNYRDLSTENRAKGFDCSGFVGWAAYQVMQTKSGVGSGYTVVSGEVGSTYKARGWGSILTQSDLSKSDWTFKPGDIGYNEGHVWIVLGQCSDKSLVIVHSTPNAGVQIAGTPTPNGTYGSQAIALAQKYMSRYPGYAKYGSAYHTSSGNYSRNGNYFRWNRNTLSDPDGYLSKTADQILADLFS